MPDGPHLAQPAKGSLVTLALAPVTSMSNTGAPAAVSMM